MKTLSWIVREWGVFAVLFIVTPLLVFVFTGWTIALVLCLFFAAVAAAFEVLRMVDDRQHTR